MNPAVITSRRAMKDLADIKAKHADIISEMSLQRQKVDMYNEQRQQQQTAEKQNQMAINGEIKKAEIAASADVQKTTMQNDLKRAELEIKRMALSQP